MKSYLMLLLVGFISCTDNRSSSSGTNSANTDSITFRNRMTAFQKLYADPNSPYRNESEALKIYDSIIASPWYSAAEKLGIQQKVLLAQQNRVGQPANDFPYTTPGGEMKRMHAIKANFILLYFNNPECEACKEMKGALSQSTIINQKLKTGELKVLSIYVDTDEQTWRTHLREYPKQWLQGITDGTLRKDKVYDLSAIPTMYLLDKDKKILLKDYFTVQSIEQLMK